MKKYGKIISDPEGPSTQAFSFSISKGQVVRRGQFVQINVPDGRMIARVSDIIKSNRFFDRPETVSEYESSGKALSDLFPVDEWTYLVARAVPMGVFTKDKGFTETDFPPSPGDVVLEPEPEILEKFFGFEAGGLRIGTVSLHDTEVRLNLDKLIPGFEVTHVWGETPEFAQPFREARRAQVRLRRQWRQELHVEQHSGRRGRSPRGRHALLLGECDYMARECMRIYGREKK